MRNRIFVCFGLMLLTAFLFAQSSTKVYITSKGKKYHTATCRIIKDSVKTELTKEQAVNAGYEPCKVCKP